MPSITVTFTSIHKDGPEDSTSMKEVLLDLMEQESRNTGLPVWGMSILNEDGTEECLAEPDDGSDRGECDDCE